MKAHRSLIRRLCFALVTARTLAFAIAPFIDLQALPVGQQVAVAPSQESDGTGVAFHDPSTCAICALLHDAPWMPSLAATTHESVVSIRETAARAVAATPSAPRQGFRSRAPPAFG